MRDVVMAKVARAGYFAKGVVYAVVGLLALQTAFLDGGKLTGGRGAIEEIARQPFGRALIGVLAVGLVSYVLWRWTQAILDPDNQGTDAKAITVRSTLFISGAIYAGLALVAIKLLIGSGESGGSSKQSIAASVLEKPWGPYAVGLAALLVVVKAAADFYKGSTARFEHKWKTEEMSKAVQRWARRIARTGVFARGVVLLITAGFIATAALQSDPSDVKGVGGVLSTAASQPYGRWLLGATALGLVCYALYQVMQARYRRVPA